MNKPSENLRDRAKKHLEAMEWSAARTVLESILTSAPGDLQARLHLAEVLQKQGGFRASTGQLLEAAKWLTGEEGEPGIWLVQRLCLAGEVVAARTCLDRLSTPAIESASTLVALAHLRWVLGEFLPARQLLEKAFELGMERPEHFHLYATVLQVTGAIGPAESVLEDCLRKWGHFGDAMVSLSNLRTQTEAGNHIELLHRRLADMSQGERTAQDGFVRAEFEWALFKEMDDLGRYEEAWPALSRCNTLMRALNPYDGVGEATVVEALTDVAGSLRSRDQAASGPVRGPTPIFIVGMPRSGTTLLDRMLSNHSQIASAGEINDFIRQLHWTADVPPGGIMSMLMALSRAPRINFAELGERYLSQTQWRAGGKRFYIDKLPVNIQMVPFIRRALPSAPILHMVRDPMDVCYSNWRAMFGNVSAYSYDLMALAHYHGLYRRLSDAWRAGAPGTMLDVSYAELVAEPETVIRRVLKYCGLEVEPGCVHPERNNAPVATPSSMQVREPIHTRAMGQWRNYARQLEPLRMALEGQATRSAGRG